jgi:hypothetical protein
MQIVNCSCFLDVVDDKAVRLSYVCDRDAIWDEGTTLREGVHSMGVHSMGVHSMTR